MAEMLQDLMTDSEDLSMVWPRKKVPFSMDQYYEDLHRSREKYGPKDPESSQEQLLKEIRNFYLEDVVDLDYGFFKKRRSPIRPDTSKYGIQAALQRHNAMPSEKRRKKICEDKVELTKLRGAGYYHVERWPSDWKPPCPRLLLPEKRVEVKYEYDPNYQWYRKPPKATYTRCDQKPRKPRPPKLSINLPPLSYMRPGYKLQFLTEEGLKRRYTWQPGKMSIPEGHEYLQDYLKLATKWKYRKTTFDT